MISPPACAHTKSWLKHCKLEHQFAHFFANLLIEPDMRIHDAKRLQQTLERAQAETQAVYLLVIATKPCYIKLASLVKQLRARAVPTLILDAGQHYDAILTGAASELRYLDEIDIFLDIRGSILGRTADLARQIEHLHAHLQTFSSSVGLRFIPVVSGDTSTSGTFPLFWYLQTGVRAIHVEAGLRSLTPFTKGQSVSLGDVLDQAQGNWLIEPDEPFPEQLDSRLTSVASSLLLAPVARNQNNLLREGYAQAAMRLSGSLSADAVLLAQHHAPGASAVLTDALLECHPDLLSKKWLRVDIHRRENMTLQRLNAVVDAVCQLAQQGLPVIFMLTNQFCFAEQRYPQQQFRQRLQQSGVHCQPLWPSYRDVITFLCSSNCLAIYTDSGGLQEEAHILGIPCMTCRYSTDRPETILDSRSNLLIPPDSATLVYHAILYCLEQGRQSVWRDLGSNIYGNEVAKQIVDHMLNTAQ